MTARELRATKPAFVKELNDAYYGEPLITPDGEEFEYKNAKQWLIACGLNNTQANTVIKATKRSRAAEFEERYQIRPLAIA